MLIFKQLELHYLHFLEYKRVKIGTGLWMMLVDNTVLNSSARINRHSIKFKIQALYQI